MRRAIFAIALSVSITLLLTAAAAFRDCPKSQMALGTTYAEIKIACPDIGVQAVDRIEPNIAVYYCPSQSALVLGSMGTGKVVGLMVVDYDPRAPQ